MHKNTFVHLCTSFINPMRTIFSKKRATIDLNNICQFQVIRRIFTKPKERTGRQTNPFHKYFSTLLESVNKN